MDLIFAGLLLIGLIILANVLVVRQKAVEIRLFHWALFALNLPFLFMGLVLIALPADVLAEMNEAVGLSIRDTAPFGLVLILAAGWGLTAALFPVRRLIARVVPIDPGSPVHTLALVMTGYLIAQGGLALSQGGLEGLTEMAEPASLGFFVLSEALFAVVALFGVGFVVRRNGRELLQRLGLVRPSPIQLVIGSGWIVALVIMQAFAGAVWALSNPEQAEIVEGLNTVLLQNMDTVWKWLILALAAGIGEEILFRGALQPVFGLLGTSIVFALVHVQYGFTPVMLVIVFLALILGHIRRRHNTTTAIFVHAGYNFILGLLALLAAYLEPYLEQLAT
jgi:uncharacterized protein